MNVKIALCVLLLLLLPGQVQALGISPARIVLDYENALQKMIVITVENGDAEEKEVTLSVAGELVDYITLSVEKLTIPPYNQAKVLALLSLDKPLPDTRLYKTRIRAVEYVLLEGTATARAAVESQLWVDTAMRGTAVDIALNVDDLGSGFRPGVEIENRGITPLTASLLLEIFPLGSEEPIASSFLPPVDILPGERTTHSFIVSARDLENGDFTARAILTLDDRVLVKERSFSSGVPLVAITSASLSTVTARGAQPVNIELANTFPFPLTASLILDLAVRNIPVSSFTAGTVALDPGETRTHTILWGVEGIEPGSYTLTVSADAEGSRTSRAVPVDVVPEQQSPLKPLLFLGILGLLMSVIWFLNLR